jgi:uncharacterized protein YjiS (DUF1127 family)
MFRFVHRLLQDLHLAGWLASPARLAHHVASAVAERHQRTLVYRELQSLDASMLRDLGLSHRAAAECPRDRDRFVAR